MRRNYQQASLDIGDVDPNPIVQLRTWFEQAREVNSGDWFEPNAMTLATTAKDGMPSARIVLLKDIDDDGLVFYTNYASQKGRELEANPKACLVFHWPNLERQVRIAGHVIKVPRERSEAYFTSRPRGSQLGALASQQSQVVRDRKMLEDKLAELESQYGEDKPIPMPETWGGYKLEPSQFVFWQGRPNRLHDRLRYRLPHSDDMDVSPSGWAIERLSP